MSNRIKRKERILKLTYLAMMTAIVILFEVLSVFSGGIFTLTFALIPIVIGSAICGPWGGAWLGGVFGGVVLATGKATFFLDINIIGTIITVMLKGVCAGLAAGFVFYVLSKIKNKAMATVLPVVAAAVTAPIVNTGIFLLGSVLFFFDFLSNEAGGGFSVTFAHILTGYIGVNFFVELGINLLLAPVLIRLIELLNKKAFKI